MEILAVGAIFVDIKGYPIGHFDPKGRNVGRMEFIHGGVMRNVAEDIANMGQKVSLLSVLDDTSVSLEVLKRLQKSNVGIDYIRITDDGLGTWLAIFDESGDVHSSISKRPGLLPIMDIVDEKGPQMFHDASCVALDISDEKEMLKKVMDNAKKYNKKIYAAVSNMTEAMNNKELFDGLSCFVCNKQEAGILFNENYDHTNAFDMLSILKGKINNINIDAMVVTLGADGACYVSKEGESGICDAVFTEVKDTTGAGDAFFAGVTVGLNTGASLKKACEIGSLIASKTINRFDNVCPIIDLKEYGF